MVVDLGPRPGGGVCRSKQALPAASSLPLRSRKPKSRCGRGHAAVRAPITMTGTSSAPQVIGRVRTHLRRGVQARSVGARWSNAVGGLTMAFTTPLIVRRCHRAVQSAVAKESGAEPRSPVSLPLVERRSAGPPDSAVRVIVAGRCHELRVGHSRQSRPRIGRRRTSGAHACFVRSLRRRAYNCVSVVDLITPSVYWRRR